MSLEKNPRKMGYIFPKRIQNILRGEDAKTTVYMNTGLDVNNIPRTVGERWIDANGKEWEQFDGYRARIDNKLPKHSDLFPTRCRRCNKLLHGKLDAKFMIYRQNCYDCQVEFETFLRTFGVWKQYEDYKIRLNLLSFLNDTKTEMSEFLDGIESRAQYVTEDGKIEKWSGDIVATKQFLEKELNDITDSITQIELSTREFDVQFYENKFKENEYYESLRRKREEEYSTSNNTTEN